MMTLLSPTAAKSLRLSLGPMFCLALLLAPETVLAQAEALPADLESPIAPVPPPPEDESEASDTPVGPPEDAGQVEKDDDLAEPNPEGRPMPPPPPAPGTAQAPMGPSGVGPRPGAQRPWPASPPPAASWIRDENREVRRPFSFTAGVGPGYLNLRDSQGSTGDNGLAYMVRLAIEVERDWEAFIAFEGTGVGAQNALTGTDAKVEQNATLLGIRWTLADRFSLRAAVGSASIDDDNTNLFVQDRGLALHVGGGIEMLRGRHFAMGLEASLTSAKYARQTWDMFGLNLVLAFF